MKIPYVVLADGANQSGDGKVNILGLFSRIYAHEVPFQHLSMSLVFGVTAEPAERGKTVPVQVMLLDEDAKKIWGGTANISVPATDELSPGSAFILNIVGLAIPNFGSYRFEVHFDGEAQNEYCFTVDRIPE